MKVSEYIVKYLIEQEITDVFGYPGGMVTHLIDSLGKHANEIATHITYHEQGAAFAACGYAQASGKVGVAFATSGPGATNLITGICNAYFDSIPTVFITGQVNTFESRKENGIRQKGFQETDIVSMVKEVTKKAFYINDAERVPDILAESFRIATQGRRGPVLLDIPMDILKADISGFYPISKLENLYIEDNSPYLEDVLKAELSKAHRPCLLLGNGIKQTDNIDKVRRLVRNCSIPVVSSMLAVDLIPETEKNGVYYGFVGAYGNRTANFVVAKCDLLICIGSRLDVRQVGINRENFAPQAKIIRIDIDENELLNRVHIDEIQVKMQITQALTIFERTLLNYEFNMEWLEVCREIKARVKYIDEKEPNRIINKVSKAIPDRYSIVTDVGQNMVWVAQSFKMQENQRLYMSGGHGAMGYALPAAIGIYYATRKPVICFCGDGGFQMNIQELQFVACNQLPITMIVLNNEALGMIRHFQEMYFSGRYYYTIENGGYTVPDFCKVAAAYQIDTIRINRIEELDCVDWHKLRPQLIEIMLDVNTVVSPKLEFGKPNQDQEPLLERNLYQYLMNL